MIVRNDFDQGTDEWLAYRRCGIGSSDCPVIMGVSPYMSLSELYQDKKGTLVKDNKSDFVLRLGHEFEIKARARFELDTGLEVEPLNVEHAKEPWLRASLDACSLEQKTFAEIKYMGQKNFDLVKSGQVLEHHVPQIQHQFMVTGFANGYYVVYTLSEDKKAIQEYFCLEVKPDHDYIINKLYPALKDFWQMVTSSIAPLEIPKVRKKRSK